jgi:putative phage-type endonuclease
MATASYRDREEWLAERKTGIGGSDAAAVLGVSPYKSALDLWREKVSDESESDAATTVMLMGNYLEPLAADLYAQETGRQMRRQPLRRHPEHDFMIGNVDRQILAGVLRSTGVLEIKCPGLRVFAGAKAKGLPDHMTVQLMHYLAVLGYSWGSFALLCRETGEFIHFDLEADPRLIATLIEREHEFWTKYVVPRVEPPAETEKVTDIPHIEGEMTVVDGDDWRAAATALREARQLKDAAEELEETAKLKVQEFMHREELHAAEVPGLARFYYRPYPGSTKWKETAQAVAREAKLDVEQFIVKGEAYTRFTPYFLRPSEED